MWARPPPGANSAHEVEHPSRIPTNQVQVLLDKAATASLTGRSMRSAQSLRS